MTASPENSAIELSASCADDVDGISRIEDESFSDPWSRESIANLIAQDAALCLTAKKKDGSVAGYAFMYVVGDESELLNIAVAPDARRRGIARTMMREALSGAEALGAVVTYLEVRASNGSAAALYSSLGFERIGARKNYYRYPTEDAVLMAKILRLPECDLEC